MAHSLTDTVYTDLEASLKNKISGEVYFDQTSKILYSTDASNYQIEPIGVVVPKNEDDISQIIDIASSYEVAILPRGSGTSLAGQAVGHSLVVDLSKYLDRVINVSREEKIVRVQSGMFLESLNRELKPYGLMFGPDPSSAKVATIGGVVANNATGAHSILYGMAGDNVEACKLYMDKAEQVELGKTSGNTLMEKLNSFKEKHSVLIENDFPKHWRRASGYSLNYFIGSDFNPAKLLAGSEGTLGLAAEFTLNLVERPQYTGLAVLQFKEIVSAMEAVPVILEQEPSAIELIDKYLIDLTRESPSYSKLLTFIDGNPEALLVVEFYGASEQEVEKKAASLKSYLVSKKIKCDISYALTPKSQADVWAVRRAGLGLLMSKRDEHKPIPCIEDVSVPVDQLADYTADITDLISRLSTKAGFYGHASAGCLHIRPLVNLKTQAGRGLMKELTDETFKLALRYGGVMSGEHGDGLQRSYLNKQLFGEELYGSMVELKSLFDPNGLFNPGKVVDAPSAEDNLRFGESYRPQAITTYLDWSSDNGISGAAEMCSGQGVCRKINEGIMCPSYMATRDEIDTTRSRANMLRAVFSGAISKETMADPEMRKVFDLCISCKACKSECPSGVDAAKMKLEFLAHYHAEHGYSLRERLFGYVHELAKHSSLIPSISNTLSNNAFSKVFLLKLGINSARSSPNLSKQQFIKWFNNREQPTHNTTHKKIIYFHDTWTNYYHPDIGIAAVKLLEEAGFEVLLIEKRECCGRPMLSKGMIEPARKRALKNASLLAPYAKEGIPIVGTEPSCILTFRDEYLDLLPQDEDISVLAKNSYTLDEFLTNLHESGELKINWKKSGPNVLYHGHCHQRSLIGNETAMQMLSLAGCSATESGAGCCGMAGSFGYESEHYEISKAICEDRLLPAIREISPDTIIAVSGVSCQDQIEHFSQRRTKHIAQVLADQIR